MAYLQVKKHRENYEVNVFHSRDSKSCYNNLIKNDPNLIAQILIDLWIHGFNIEKAVKIFLSKMKKKDWMEI